MNLALKANYLHKELLPLFKVKYFSSRWQAINKAYWNQ